MTYEELLKNAPPHNSLEFIDYLRENNEVLNEDPWWIVIKNTKYGWPTAFAKVENANILPLIAWYGDYEWRVKPKSKRTVERFHIHIITNQ
jgi:hypothetical protein